MPDFNQNMGGASPNESGAGSGSQVPSSPGVEVGMRTMESDLNSFNASGGVQASPEVTKVGATAPSPSGGTLTPGTEFSFPANGGGGDSLTATPDSSLPPVMEGGSSKKKIVIILAVLLGAAALGVLGYFVVYPLLFPPAPVPVIQTKPVAPATPAAPPLQPEPSMPAPASTTLKHESLLIIKANETQEINLPAIDLVNIKASFLQAASLKLPKDSMKELVLLGPGALNLTFNKLFLALVPDMAADALTNLEDDFSLVLYFDDLGAWPVYVAKLKEGTVLSNAQTALAKLEESTKLGNLFNENPGPSIGKFTNGQLGSKAVRYLKFTTKNASLNYGWLGDYFFISTNYNGAKELARRLGF